MIDVPTPLKGFASKANVEPVTPVVTSSFSTHDIFDMSREESEEFALAYIKAMTPRVQ